MLWITNKGGGIRAAIVSVSRNFRLTDLPGEIIGKINTFIQKINEDPRFRKKIRYLGQETIYQDSESAKKQ
jgi:tripartite-type tricarboxylate transporter receptor subunit TctC